MESYYQRYMSGERNEVWQELLLQGEALRHAPLLDEAISVCREVVERCYRNLSNLRGTLIELGYRFRNPQDTLRRPSAEERSTVDQIEGTYGLMPLLARVWYEQIGSVDFSQDQSQLYSHNVPDGEVDKVAGLGYHQVLTFLSLSKCLELQQQLIDDNQEDQENCANLLHFLPTGGFGSNSEPKGFQLPDSVIDGVLYNEGFGDVRLMDELRTAFLWGGFPFWKRIIQQPKAISSIKVVPDFVHLLPILTDGLSQI